MSENIPETGEEWFKMASLRLPSPRTGLEIEFTDDLHVYGIKMDPTVKALWVEALRSGRYKQEVGNLRGGCGWCCLGVLLDTMAPDRWKAGLDCGQHLDQVPGCEFPSNNFLTKVGLTFEAAETLAHLNDGWVIRDNDGDFVEEQPHRDFLTIANIIETKL